MRFTKYHGAGNDFLIVEADGGTADWPALALAMCERHTGVGADGLLVVEASAKAAHRMVLFNADGSEAEMSGNGIRCFAKHVIEELGAPRDLLTIETLAGIHEITPRLESGRVVAARVGMGAPRFDPAQIPVTARGVERVIDYPLDVGEASLRITSLSMGNPHAVAFIDEPVEDWPLERVGPLVERNPFFPRRCELRDRQRREPGTAQGAGLGARSERDDGVRQRGLRRSRRGPDQGPGGRVGGGEPPRRRAEDRLGRRGRSLA